MSVAINLDRLKSNSDAMLAQAERLVTFVLDLHKRRQFEVARVLAPELNSELGDYLKEEGAALRAIGWRIDPALCDAIEKSRQEYVTLWEVMYPVVYGLQEVGPEWLPVQRTDHATATIIFYERLRKHIAYKREVLYPLLDRLINCGSGAGAINDLAD